MTTVAPHLTSPLRHIYPLYGPEERALRVRPVSRWERCYARRRVRPPS